MRWLTLLLVLLIVGCKHPSPGKPDDRAERIVGEDEGTLVVTTACNGQYLPMLWSDDQEWPAQPYCFDPEKTWIPYDYNFDTAVNTVDLTEAMFLCYSGPSMPYPTTKNGSPVSCGMADRDNDGDVDQNDFGLIQREVSAVKRMTCRNRMVPKPRKAAGSVGLMDRKPKGSARANTTVLSQELANDRPCIYYREASKVVKA